MQNFCLHSHSKSVVFDARDSVLEMAKAAEAFGFTVYGISNHLNVHPNIQKYMPMYFHTPEEAREYYLQVRDEIAEASAKASIPILFGFEVDFYPSASWRHMFEKLMKELQPDYLIGATHCFRTPDESVIYDGHHAEEVATMDESFKQSYFDNVKACAQSGYFDFIAHLDLPKKFFPDFSFRYQDRFMELIDVFGSLKTAVEINTGGRRRSFINEFFPSPFLVDALKKKEVPLLISDDSHRTEEIGTFFNEAEDMLAGYPHRFTLSDLKKAFK